MASNRTPRKENPETQSSMLLVERAGQARPCTRSPGAVRGAEPRLVETEVSVASLVVGMDMVRGCPVVGVGAMDLGVAVAAVPGVDVDVPLDRLVGLDVGVAVGAVVAVAVGELVGVEVGVLVGVEVGVLVGVDVRVAVGDLVGVEVGVSVGVAVGVGRPGVADTGP
jgi:hypothetical protein